MSCERKTTTASNREKDFIELHGKTGVCEVAKKKRVTTTATTTPNDLTLKKAELVSQPFNCI